MMHYYLATLLLASAVVAASGEATELGVDNFCTDCDCDFKSGKILCSDLADVSVKQMPESLQWIEIKNASRVTLESGAVQAKKEKFQIHVQDAKYLIFKKRSVSLLYPYSRVEVSAFGIGEVKFDSLCVRGKGGRVNVNINSVQVMEISEKSFDILNSLTVSEVEILNLSPYSLKPNTPRSATDLNVRFENVSLIPMIPTHTFSSSQSIVISGCKIKEIGENAFSGIQFDEIRFSGCNIDRIHSKAFIPFSLVSALSFRHCQITSISESAIQSAITELEISNCKISSLSHNSLDCQVAKVRIDNNVFKTLVAKTFKISSWNDFSLSQNEIQFMDSEALFGIVKPGSGDVNITFNMSRNVIDYANRNALALQLPNNTQLLVEGNLFSRQCDCDIVQWLDFLVGDSPLILNSEVLRNSSFCSTPDYLQDCFVGQTHILIENYLNKICRTVDGIDPEQDCRISPFWSMIEDQIQIDTNKGILLTILLAAIFLSLIVSICTLLRWIVYMIQIRTRVKTTEEWNFTKIEEKQVFATSPDTDHYEKLPLTEEEDIPDKEDDFVSATESLPETRDDETKNSEKKSGPIAARKSATFYDEMIDLLKEKLDDPDNYATVADTKAQGQDAVNLELYENPFDKKENVNITKET